MTFDLFTKVNDSGPRGPLVTSKKTKLKIHVVEFSNRVDPDEAAYYEHHTPIYTACSLVFEFSILWKKLFFVICLRVQNYEIFLL